MRKGRLGEICISKRRNKGWFGNYLNLRDRLQDVNIFNKHRCIVPPQKLRCRVCLWSGGRAEVERRKGEGRAEVLWRWNEDMVC